MRRVPVQWALIAAASVIAAFLTAQSELGQRINLAVRDAGVRMLLREVPSDIVIVGIDAKSLAELDEWPWPRRHHADLIDTLAVAPPRRLFLDIDFSSRSDTSNDEQLRAALAAWPGANPVLPAFQQQQSSSGGETLFTVPMDVLRPHVEIASVNLLPDVDGLVRRVDARTAAGNAPAVAALLGGIDGGPPAPIWIDYSIDPSSFTYLSYSDVLAQRVPAEYYADKTVLVGATAVELGDMLPVPLHRSLPGVVVQALALQSVRGVHHSKPATAVYWAALALLTLLASYGLRRLGWRQNILLIAAAVAAVCACGIIAYAALAYIVDVVPLIVALTTAYLLATIVTLRAETIRALVYAIGFRRRDALLKSIVLSSTDSILCIDSTGRVRTANPAASGLFGCAVRSLAGRHIGSFLPLLDTQHAGPSVPGLDALAENIVESTGRTAAGEEFPVELSVSQVRLKDERLYTIIVRNISERKAQQRQLQFQATHDPLTSLPNRAALAAHLDAQLARIGENGQLALLMIDLDRFKEVNDTLGHNIGDYVLHEVAARMARIAEEYGFIARIGGDEFALVTDRFEDLGGVEEVCRRLVDCLDRPVETCGIAIDVGLSIGIALSAGGDAESLFKQADVAMYSAKHNRSGYEYYDPAEDRNSVRRLQIASRLRRAIADDRLELHYQPQVDLSSGRVASVEALLRWEDEELGQVSPGEFIALAELTDLIRPLTDWTFARAFAQAVRWRDAGLPLRIAINVSARVLQDGNFPERLQALLAGTGLPPSQFELEITESAMMLDPKRALQIIGRLGELGVPISIDDYGTGYSSLAYLRDLPVHALKLDKSFVMNMQSSEDDRVIVESTARMAHALRVQAVAEGVQSPADEALLRRYGYDLAQGYLYSPALAPEALPAWVQSFHRSGTVTQIAAR